MAKFSDLQKRRKQLVDSINSAFRELEGIDEQILSRIEKAKDALLGDEVPGLKLRNRPPRFSPAEPEESPRKDGREPSLKAPIMRAIASHGSAITQQELLEYLRKHGVEVKGKNPKSTLSAHVSYLIKKNVLARVGKKLVLKQPMLIDVENENAARTH